MSITPTNGGAKELFGVLVELRQPRARVSRSQNRERVFSALGELLWYLSGSDDAEQIGYYVSYYKDPAVSVDGHVIGAYGPRLMQYDDVNQVEAVIQMLRKNPDSRNAVIQLFDHQDSNNAPCTLALQFVVRERKLIMMTSMRSNDLFWGFPHDLFAFTMIQEIIARSVGVDIGNYYHSVGSLHLYMKDVEAADRYLGEGWHDAVTMPAMPDGDPWEQIHNLLALEKFIRLSSSLGIQDLQLPNHAYWRDLALLLFGYKLIREGRKDDLAETALRIESSYFRSIVQDRVDRHGSRKATSDSQR
ncbi:thymidylate synthase [Arthrobacter sp. ok362]|uniref:thymidylate synthase n=1 Tax=Arthrobacter sp. ok362 TaxID=1761745 RepID=UPI00158809E0|nr:thymidylate synthase [Arthrobacter sp. ok362]